MCLAYPGTVKKIKGLSAVVEYPSFTKQVLLGDKNVCVGDRVLVQMWVIINKISPADSKKITDLWTELNGD